MGIYTITNLINGKFYLGSSNNLAKRKREHIWALRKNEHNNPHLQNAFNKYGEKSFKFEIIEIIKPEENLLIIEQKRIDEYDACNREKGYNINRYASGGGLFGKDNPNFGKHMSEEQKIKIRKTMIGEKYSSDRCKNMSMARTGKYIGSQNHNFGKEVTKERRKLQSKAMVGRFDGEKNPFYGKEHSMETKLKMSETRKGRTGELCPNSIRIVQLTKQGEFIKEFCALQEAFRQTGIWTSNIGNCIKGKLKTAGGYKWMYLDEYNKSALIV